MAGGSDLQPSKSAKNAATCKKRQGADIKKKKQSCDVNETSHKEKKIDDRSDKKKEDDKYSKVAIKKDKEDGNNDGGADKEEEVLKKNDDKLSEVSVNKNQEDCNNEGAANINDGEKCKRKAALSKETDPFIKGIVSIGENKECSSCKDTNKKVEFGLNNDKAQSSRFDSNDVNKKEMIKERESENIGKVNHGIKIMDASKNTEKDISNNNNNIESHKKDNEAKVVTVRDIPDVKKATETSVKEDCFTQGGNNSASSGDKDSPKKRQFFYNNRGRGSYGNNRGRNFNWRGGWGYNNYNRYQNRRMMNSGPSSAYRGKDDHRNNYSESARGHTKMSSPFQPEAPPQAFIGSLQPVYFDSQINYQDCYYFPQVWPPQQSGTYYQESLDVSAAHAKVGETEVPAYNPYAGDVSLSVQVSKENMKAETNGRNNLDHDKPPANHQSGQTEDEGNQLQEGHGISSNIIASVSSNPLFELGKSAEHDKQLVQTFAGIEMRPSVQLPPDFGLQWFFIPYGAALPPSVIPVMVVPFINAADNMYQARQDANGGHDQGFQPPQSLLPSYFNNADFQTPSPVDSFQPAVRTWPNQPMAPMTAGNPAQYVFPQIHSSQTEIHAENKLKAK